MGQKCSKRESKEQETSREKTAASNSRVKAAPLPQPPGAVDTSIPPESSTKTPQSPPHQVGKKETTSKQSRTPPEEKVEHKGPPKSPTKEPEESKDASEPTMSLLEACESGNDAEVRLNIETGAELGEKNDYGATALHLAARGNFFGIVELLLESNANPNEVDDSQSTPLHYAASTGAKESILLLAPKSDKSATNNNGETPKNVAEATHHQEVAELLC